MADKKNSSDDEYEYDPFQAEESGDVYSSDEPIQAQAEERKSGSPILRNSLILLGTLAILVVGYRMVTLFMAKKPVSEMDVTSVATTRPSVVAPKPQPVVQTPEPVIQPIQTSAMDDESKRRIEQQLQTLESSQQTMQNQVSSLHDQIQSVGSNMTALTKQIENLNQTVITLSDKMSEESEKLAALTLCNKKPPKVVIHKVKKIIAHPTVFYHLQAIIPGRAWLIGTNGSTLTVREGSIVPGFGVVKLVDAMQGRVLMKSGQVIEFSQQDS